jgi:hypothetical protein
MTKATLAGVGDGSQGSHHPDVTGRLSQGRFGLSSGFQRPIPPLTAACLNGATEPMETSWRRLDKPEGHTDKRRNEPWSKP